jgi:hypothetical protein
VGAAADLERLLSALVVVLTAAGGFVVAVVGAVAVVVVDDVDDVDELVSGTMRAVTGCGGTSLSPSASRLAGTLGLAVTIGFAATVGPDPDADAALVPALRMAVPTPATRIKAKTPAKTTPGQPCCRVRGNRPLARLLRGRLLTVMVFVLIARWSMTATVPATGAGEGLARP